MFATVIGLFASQGKYRKFVSLVLGFVLLLLMIQPLAVFFGGRDVPRWFAGMPGFEASLANLDYHDLWDSHLRDMFEAQLEAQLANLLTDFTVHSAEFEYSDDFMELTLVRVSVGEKIPERVPFIRIQPPQIRPVRIGDYEPDNCSVTETVKTLISEFYNLPKSHIHVKVI